MLTGIMRRAYHPGGLQGLDQSLGRRRVVSAKSPRSSTTTTSLEIGVFRSFLSVPHPKRLCQPFFTSALVTRTQLGSIMPMGMLKPHELATGDRVRRDFRSDLDQRLDEPRY